MADTGDTDQQAKRDAAAARRQRIMEGAENRMDVVEGRASGAAAGTSTTSTSSKLAAMRKRRFKKKTATETTAKEEEAPVATEPAAVAVEETLPTATTTTTTTTTNDTEGESDKKKQYMGVARMRRKMIKEKQQQAPPPTETTTKTPSKATEKVATKVQRKNDTSLPILMHMVTVFLLFWAGLDIGMQQHQKSLAAADSNIMVHTAFAPRTDGGVHRLLHYATGQTTTTSSTKKTPILAEPVWQDALQDSDEFMDANADEEPNLDPLFGVDLDKATAGPGIIPWAARQAVKVHRQLLQVLYYYPLRLFSNPPVLCLLALLLRQLVGKTLLGAQLPTVEETTAAGGGTTDLLRMAQSFVTNFLSSSFPTAVSLYDAWGHLRSDMYVILCGLFCGLALAFSAAPDPAAAWSSVADEL